MNRITNVFAKTHSERDEDTRSSLVLETIQRTFASINAKIGLILFLVILIGCVFAPLFTSYGPNDVDITSMYCSPNLKHIMGTDGMGRDVFARLLYGGRYSLLIGFTASGFQAIVAIIIGSIAGYFGGIVENVIMRIMDIWSSIPGTLLCILISACFGGGFVTTVVALSIGGIPSGVRMMRAQVLSERSKQYLEAEESMNCSKASIMFRHILPNVCSPMIIQLTIGIGNAITSAAGLSFIGLGIQPPTAEWGAMLSEARSHILKYSYLITFPGLFIAATIIAMNLIGDGIRDALDPRMRK